MLMLNWGLIQSGGTFESLMHAILYAEDHSTILFGRPGPDQGQDARSADGSIVYQAKFRSDFTMATVISIAKKELTKIKEYRQSDHPNYQHWQDAKQWILVANIRINPNDNARWEREVVPLFAKEGLEAKFWCIETLEGKLSEHPEIRDVFFQGKNRVLVSLAEAYELIGGELLTHNFVGREQEMQQIKEFATDESKRVLPIVGSGGIGKTRLMYESLLELAADGWRVLWALTDSMSQSSEWFKLLDGSQDTCVAIDAPEDSRLLRRVIEQLATTERRKWKVIVAYRSGRTDVLQRYLGHPMVAEQMKLKPLDEDSSKTLLNETIGYEVEKSSAYNIYRFTQGVPTWICLIASLLKSKRTYANFTSSIVVVNAYIDSCLESLSESSQSKAKTLLNWLSLWGTLKLDADCHVKPEVVFLNGKGIPFSELQDLLKELSRIGLVRNWGVDKRLYAVDPQIVRQEILAKWLLCADTDQYSVNSQGKHLIKQLIDGEIPLFDAALKTLSNLALSRLPESKVFSLMKPFFDITIETAKNGYLMQQYRVLDIIEKVGESDPEAALEAMVTLRTNEKEDQTIESSVWGPHTLTHKELIAKLPKLLSHIANSVSNPSIAAKFISEFEVLINMQDRALFKVTPGEEPRELLKKLLKNSKRAGVFALPAFEFVLRELLDPSELKWPFVVHIAKSLLDPIYEPFDFISRWTINFGKSFMAPGSRYWGKFIELRKKILETLQTDSDSNIRRDLWSIIASSHSQIHYILLHEKISPDLEFSYEELLKEDLTVAALVLQQPPSPISVEESTQARKLWEWHIEYGKKQDFVELAEQCEALYEKLSPWRFHEFFRFDTAKNLVQETDLVTNKLRSFTDVNELWDFFAEVERYLKAARPEHKDMADYGRIVDLADNCLDLVQDITAKSQSTLIIFIVEVLAQEPQKHEMAWRFTTRICQKYLCRIKQDEGLEATEDAIKNLLQLTAAKHKLLYAIYSNAHPESTGKLSKFELDTVLAYEGMFSPHELCVLLGAFYIVDVLKVTERLYKQLTSLDNNTKEASSCMADFIYQVHIACMRYETLPDKSLTAWIVNSIAKLSLSGSILKSFELEWIRKKTAFKMSMVSFVAFLKQRLATEERLKPASSDDIGLTRFEAMPYGFDLSVWCSFDTLDQKEIEAFQELCKLALGEGFTAQYWLPKYIAHFNDNGILVKEFVVEQLRSKHTPELNYLARLSYLAASYPNDTQAWAEIAYPICQNAQCFNREDRSYIYHCLSQKIHTSVSGIPGEIPKYYVEKLEISKRLLDVEPEDSPLREYRELTYNSAKAELDFEKERLEELCG